MNVKLKIIFNKNEINYLLKFFEYPCLCLGQSEAAYEKP